MVASAFRPGTMSNYKTHWKSYFRFCVFFGFTPLPITEEQLVCFIAFLYRSFKCVNTLLNYKSGLKALQQWCGFSVEPFNSYKLYLLFRAIRLHTPHQVKQKLPITTVVLLNIFGVLDFHKVSHIVLWAAFLLCFYTLLRKSNLVPRSEKTFDSKEHLTRSQIHVFHDSLLVSVKWSKVLQFRNKVVRIPVLAVPGSPLCPVTAYRLMLSLVPAPPSSPAFVYPTARGLVPLTHFTFVTQLRGLLATCGYNPSNFSGHSFRRGGATFLHQAGFSLQEIKILGDWSSNSVTRYLNIDLNTRQILAQKFAHAVKLEY